jgi:glycosyltransferase involved in cell wall biosynthesis
MRVAIYLDPVNQAIDNAMQWNVMLQIKDSLINFHDVRIIDTLKIGEKAALDELGKEDFDFLLMYNKTGVNLVNEASGNNFLKNINVPQISWLVEHPITFLNEYKQTNSPWRNYIAPNYSHAFCAEKMGIEGQFTSNLFGSSIKKIKGDFNKRPYDICISAQWRGEAEINEFWKEMIGIKKNFFEDINALQKIEENSDVFISFLAVANHYKIELDNLSDFSMHMKAMYWHARKSERIKMVKDLVATGLKIILVGGDEWKAVLPNYENVIFVKPCTHQKLIEYYMQSRAVASTNCFNGANERTFDAMSCGSISIAENSPTLMKYFNDLESIIFYERNAAEFRSDIIRDLLNDHSKSELIAENGRENFMQNHTWSSRVDDLNILMNKIKLQ